MKSELRNLQQSTDKKSFSKILKQNTTLYSWFLNSTNHLNHIINTSLRVTIFLNDLDTVPAPKCLFCGKIVTERTKSYQWKTHCSNKCRGQHNSFKSRELAKQTTLANWGTENPAQNKTVQSRMKAARLSNLGVEHALQSPVVQAKKTQTMLDLYGVEHAAQNPAIQQKMISKYQENWGVPNPSLRHITEETTQRLNDESWLSKENKEKSILAIAEEQGVSTYLISKAFSKFNVLPIRHNSYMSQPEIDIVEYIQSLLPNIKIITSDRTLIGPYEIDIYLPEYNIAFEYNGLYYHSEAFGKNKNYHLHKTTECEKKGVRLVHIWESDYVTNKEIVLSKIKNLLGKSAPIYARKCSIREVPVQEAKLFLDTTHIQGYCNSSIKIGLYYDNKIVACMTFIKARFTSRAEWELLRYSSAIDKSVVGGFSKSLAYFIRQYNPESIISYSDLCWSKGNVYSKNNFRYLHTAAPSYFYSLDGKTTHNRMSFQKKKMKDKLETFDESLTEAENMQANGYMKIWNCGNEAWLWERT